MSPELKQLIGNLVVAIASFFLGHRQGKKNV